MWIFAMQNSTRPLLRPVVLAVPCGVSLTVTLRADEPPKPTTGEVRIGSGRVVEYTIHFDRNSLRDSLRLGDGLIALTSSGTLLRFELFLDTTVKRYSSGMQGRLAFAVAAFLEPEIILIDEVVAVGDAEFQRKCLGRMNDVARSGRTVLFVSHNMAASRACVAVRCCWIAGRCNRSESVPPS
jgi:ABC-type multidrug transport system ATPase subunit